MIRLGQGMRLLYISWVMWRHGLDDLGLLPALRAHAERALKNTDIEFDRPCRA